MLVFWSMAALDDYRLLVASSFSCSPYVSKYGHKGRFLFGDSWRCWTRTFSVSVRQLYAKPTRELMAYECLLLADSGQDKLEIS